MFAYYSILPFTRDDESEAWLLRYEGDNSPLGSTNDST